MLRLPRRTPLLAGVVFVALSAVTARSATPAEGSGIKTGSILAIAGLGKGAAPLDGPWQFHLGDDPSYALPQTADSAGGNGWEQLTANQPWGAQDHRSYTGFAWYRKHLSLSAAAGASPEFYLFIRRIEDVYEVYWNGQFVGHYGNFPPDPSYLYSQSRPDRPPRPGARRRPCHPCLESAARLLRFRPPGRLQRRPLVGSLQAVTAEKTALDYTWLRGRQYYFAQESLYGLVMLLSLLAWIRDRSQRLLLAMAAFSGSPVIAMFLVGLRLPFSFNFALGWLQPVLALQDIGLWFLLLYLLDLAGNRRLARLTGILAIITLVSTSLDGLLTINDWSQPSITVTAQWADAILTAIFTLLELYPLVLVAFALRKRLDSSRWLLAAAAFLAGMLSVLRIALQQGSRFTNWTIGNKLTSPMFYINGNAFTPQTIANTFLLIAIIYAVFRYMRETSSPPGRIEQELKSARELQQILIPESLPELPGFAVTSAYRPAQEVGGDFFQIIPLEGEYAGSTLILLGDVSGKGLKAAMTVSLIVGAARTAAKFTPHPAGVLAELNTRLHGRMQGGFTTCLAMRLSPDGTCTMATAGHPGPFLNQRQFELPGALPLGVLPNPTYKEESITLHEGDHFSLYTDGLLEARNPSGEIFSFDRLDALFCSRPNAAEATQAAVNFGQDDDITVLTLTRLASRRPSTTEFTTPSFAPA